MARQPSYSDERLRAAVTAARSWRGVLRELGLSATSASAIRSVRRSADRLGLDYTHFSGQRRWTDAELAASVAGSSSWREVVEKVGLTDPSSQVTLKGHAARLGIDVQHLTQPAAPPSAVGLAMEPDPRHLGRSGAMVAAGWFALCGYDVSWPLEPCRYDLLVMSAGHVNRVQVKTATVRTGGSWTVWLSTTGATRSAQDPHDIDYFFVIAADLSYFLIPVAAVGGLHAIRLSAYEDFRISSL
jgi:hypothetical protein